MARTPENEKFLCLRCRTREIGPRDEEQPRKYYGGKTAEQSHGTLCNVSAITLKVSELPETYEAEGHTFRKGGSRCIYCGACVEACRKPCGGGSR